MSRGNRFSGSQSEKARGRGHCQAVRRLAIVLERVGRGVRALPLYAEAADIDSDALARRALNRLAGARAEAHLQSAQATTVSARTIQLDAKLRLARADVRLLIDEEGRVLEVRRTEGDTRLQPALDKLVGTRTSFRGPSDQPLRLVRRGIVGCGDDARCVLVLIRPVDSGPLREEGSVSRE